MTEYNRRTMHPNIPTRADREDEQEADEEETLEVVRRHALRRKDHGAHELALRGTEAGSQDNAEAATVGRLDRGWDLRGG